MTRTFRACVTATRRALGIIPAMPASQPSQLPPVSPAKGQRRLLGRWWRRQSPAQQDRFATLGPLASVLLFLAAIISAFWYLRNEELEREQASVKRDKLVLMLVEGMDPKTELTAQRNAYRKAVIGDRKPAQPSFAVCAERLHHVKQPEWKNTKHAKQWIGTLQAYVYPAIGDKPVDTVCASDVIAVLQPIWFTKTETAYRVRDRVFQVLQWAIVQGMRKSDEQLEAMVRSAFPAAGKLLSQKRKHFAALPYAEVPAFIQQFNATGVPDIIKLLHEFTILNGNRSGEARGATWDEIDLQNKRWVIDKHRMKMGVEHRIPLSSRAIDILNQAKSMHIPGNSLVFPSPNTGKMVSDSTLTNRFREMGATHTVHGYRSAMRDWAAEKTNFAWEVMEKALAHRVGGETEVAYFRSDLFEKRAEMMEAWAGWCSAT
mgnify:CR=1 FL=1